MGIFTKVGAEVQRSLAEQIAVDFTAQLDAWYGSPEVYDDELDAQIHRWYADIIVDKARKVWPPRDIPYFSPSSANSCPRELYEKLRKSPKDKTDSPPHQGRWRAVGTAIGDVIQRDLLFAEKHYAKATGAPPRFRFDRNERGEPMLEDFAKRNAIITHKGRKFALFGTCDGIMLYATEDGEVLRVGLEVKSKQTTSAQTSEYSTRNGPKEDHVKQCVCYSLMYGSEAAPIDYYVILYVNASKKAWDMTPEDYVKNPDIKAFGIEVTDEMRAGVLDYFADVLGAVERNEPPALDIDKWNFNNFKGACAVGLSDEEYARIQREVAAVIASQMPEFKRQQYANTLAKITELREVSRLEAAA
ncbi:hypothetical protein K7P76_21270 [Cohnella sp. NL03-T5]|nr:hypothetical protein [Cohnella silvisoli]